MLKWAGVDKDFDEVVKRLPIPKRDTLDEPNARPPAPFGLSEPEVQKRLCPGYPGEEQNLGDLWV